MLFALIGVFPEPHTFSTVLSVEIPANGEVLVPVLCLFLSLLSGFHLVAHEQCQDSQALQVELPAHCACTGLPLHKGGAAQRAWPGPWKGTSKRPEQPQTS